MKNKIILAIFLGSFFVFIFCLRARAENCATSTSYGGLKINEVSSASSQEDWIEIYNPFEQCVDISDFTIEHTHADQSSTKQVANGTMVISYGWSKIPMSSYLEEKSEKIILKFGDQEIDGFTYGAGFYDYLLEGEFWARFPDGTGDWQKTVSGTPGEQNIITAPTTPTSTPDVVAPTSTPEVTPTSTPQTATSTPPTEPTSTSTSAIDYSAWQFLRLNEIVSDPESGNEAVELYNSGTSTIDLTGGLLCDNRESTSTCKINTSTINAGAFFWWDLNTASFLNNDGDSVRLIDPLGNVIDQLVYSASSIGLPDKGQSLARSGSGTGDWKITTRITAGAANEIMLPAPKSSGGGGGGSAASQTNTTKTTTTTTKNTDEASNTGTSTFLGQIVINEIYPDPVGSDSEEEFVEVANLSNTEIDLTGWKLSEKDHAFNLSGKIASKGLIFWKRKISGLVLNNTTHEEIKLIDKNNQVADAVVYTKAETGKSYNRNDGNKWAWSSTITPGEANIVEDDDAVGIVWKINYLPQGNPGEAMLFDAENSADPRGGELNFIWDFGNGQILSGGEVEYNFATSGVYNISVLASSTAGTSDKKQIKVEIGAGLKQAQAGIIISEIMVDPSGRDDREFVEVYNKTTSTINISGWRLRLTAGKNYTLPDNTAIAPKSALVFYKLATKLTLNNTADKVELLNKNQDVVDLVKYEKGKEGLSYSLINGEWRYMEPSPGKVYATLESANAFQAVLGEKVVNTAKSSVKKSSAKYVAYEVIGIDDARAKEKDEGVITQGVVEVLPGVFGVQYFYITDGDSGIQIYQNKKQFPQLQVGDKVQVKGLVSEANKQKRIRVKAAQDIDILATNQNIEPRILNLSELDEELAGNLAKVTADITEIKTNNMFLDDGEAEAEVYFKRGANIDKKLFKEGDKVELTGILELSKNGIQIWPRGNDDIKVIGMADEVIKDQKGNAPANVGGWGTYISAALGAATTLVLGFATKGRGAVIMQVGKKAVALASKIIKRG